MTTYARYRSGLLQAAVQSVLSQDFQDFEFVVHDDGSHDGSADYLTQIASRDRRVRLLRHAQNVNSVSISLGRCLLESDRERPFVSWMFDDCVLLPGALGKLVQRARRSSADVVFGVTDVHLRGGDILKVGSKSVAEIRKGIPTSSVLVPNAGIIVDRKVFDAIGWYDPSIVMRRSCDWDFFRRMFAADLRCETIPDVLVDEHGDTQHDSLRNSFTTTFDIMRKFTAARDAAGLPLDVSNCLAMPIDWIPPADWTAAEIGLMQFMFLEYFLSVANIPRALGWAKRLERGLKTPSLSLSNLRIGSEDGSGARSLLSAGAYCGVMLGIYKQSLAETM